MTYNFQRQLEIGRQGAKKLDRHFGHTWDISESTQQQQRTQIDRIWRHKVIPDYGLHVEYKTDEKGHNTGNAFVEVISVDVASKQGWALMCEADLLIYLLLHSDRYYVAVPRTLKEHVPAWLDKYGMTKAENEEYNTFGSLVPIKVFASACIGVGQIASQELMEFVR